MIDRAILTKTDKVVEWFHQKGIFRPTLLKAATFVLLPSSFLTEYARFSYSEAGEASLISPIICIAVLLWIMHMNYREDQDFNAGLFDKINKRALRNRESFGNKFARMFLPFNVLLTLVITPSMLSSGYPGWEVKFIPSILQNFSFWAIVCILGSFQNPEPPKQTQSKLAMGNP